MRQSFLRALKSVRGVAISGLAMLLVPTGAFGQSQPVTDSTRQPLEVPSQGVTLRGTIRPAAGPGRHPTVIYLKGFPDVDDPALPAYLQANGFTGLSVDFRGQRSSDGQYTIEGTAEDARAVVDFLRSDAARRTYRVDPARIILVGGSAGSFAALKTTALDTRLRCVAVIVPFNWAVFGLAARSDSSLRQLAAGVMGRMTGGPRPVIRAAPDFAGSMVAAAEAYDLRSPAAALEGRAVFLVGAEQDATAPLPAHFVPLVQAARGARGTQVRDTVVADTHNLPATYEAVFAALVRWLRADCLGAR